MGDVMFCTTTLLDASTIIACSHLCRGVRRSLATLNAISLTDRRTSAYLEVTNNLLIWHIYLGPEYPFFFDVMNQDRNFLNETCVRVRSPACSLDS